MAKQFRESPPAYMEYAPDMLSNHQFRSMSLPERGLLYTLRLECWIGGSVPSDTKVLSLMLGVQLQDIVQLLDAVRFFTTEKNGRLIFPDLEKYRSEMLQRRLKQSGGAKKTNEKRWPKGSPTESPTESPTVSLPESLLSREDRSGEEGRGKAPAREGDSNYGSGVSGAAEKFDDGSLEYRKLTPDDLAGQGGQE